MTTTLILQQAGLRVDLLQIVGDSSRVLCSRDIQRLLRDLTAGRRSTSSERMRNCAKLSSTC